MSKFDSAFCISGDAVLESPGMERIDELVPVVQHQLFTTPSLTGPANQSTAFPNSEFARCGFGTNEFQVGVRFGAYPAAQNPLQSWPFAVHTIRIKGYTELAPESSTLTAFPNVQNAPWRITMNASRFDSSSANPGVNYWDDLFPANYGGPAGVTAYDRLFIFCTHVRSVSRFDQWYVETAPGAGLRGPEYPATYHEPRWGRFDPPSYDSSPTGYSNEPLHFHRNLSQLNNLGGIHQPSYQVDEQRVLAIAYQPRRGEVYFEPVRIDLPAN